MTRATATVAQLEHQADELHERYLRAARTVAGELERAGRIAPAESGWLDRIVESALSWMEKLNEPFDLLAGDQWLELVLAKGGKITDAVRDAVEGPPGLMDGRWSEVSALAHDTDHGLAAWEDVDVAARRFTALAQTGETFTEDWAKRTGWIRRATAIGENFGRVMGYAGIIGDAVTIYDPPDKGVLGNVDRGVAFVNGGLVAANMALDEFPVVGQVVMVGTGVYLGGTYAYHHWRWFHDTCDTVGHGVSSAWHWVTS